MSRVLLSIGMVHVLTMLVSLIRAKVLSVLLGPGNYGLASTVDQTAVSVVQLAGLSLPFTAMKFMAEAHSESAAAFERAFAMFLRALIALSVIAMVVVSALLWWQPGLFGKDLAPYRALFHIALLGVPAAMLHIHFVNTLAAAQRGTQSAWLTFAVGLSLAAAAILGYLWAGLPGLIGASVLAGAVAAVLALQFIRGSLVLPGSLPYAALDEFVANPRILGYSLLTYAAMSTYSLTMLSTRYLVFGKLGAVGAGLLQAQLGLALAVGSVITPLNGLYFAPLVNRRMATAEKVEAANAFAGTILVVLFGGGLVATLFPALVLTLLFSKAFVGAATTLCWFIVWQCLYQVTNVYLQLLIGLDDMRFFAVATCASYGISAIMFVPLIEQYGLGGVAMSLCLAMLFCFAAVVVRMRRRFGARIAPHVLLRTFGLLVVLIGAWWCFDPATELSRAGFAMRAGYAFASIVALWATLRPAERASMRTVIRRVTARP